MKFWKMGPRAAFEPPSDFSSGDGGGSSTTKKLLLIGGAGCGIILLIVGILFAAGAFQAVSCCNQVGDAVKKTGEAQKYGSEFALALAGRDFDQAYAMTSDDFRRDTSKEQFVSAFEPYDSYLDATPRTFNVQAGTSGQPAESMDDLGKSWTVILQFAKSNASKQLLLEVDVLATEDAGFVIDGVRAEERARAISSEPPAREVLEMHDDLAAGRYEMAYGRMAQPFKQETDVDAFKAFIKDSGGVMISNDVIIQEVDYVSDQQATVMATVTSEDGNKAVVQYELSNPIPSSQMWQIMAISTPVQADPDSTTGEPVMKGIDAGGADADVIAPEGDSNTEEGEGSSDQ